MRIKAIINDRYELSLIDFPTRTFAQDPVLKIQSTDLDYIKTILSSIQKIEVYFGDQLIATTTDYDSYSSIQYLGAVFCESEQKFAECLQVSLTKVSIVEQLNRIEEKIDNTVDIDSMSVEEYKGYLLKEISALGEAQIFEGTGVVLSDGTSKVFTYNLEDQSNITQAIALCKELDDPMMLYPYHSHGEICSLYSVTDIYIIYVTLQMMSVQVQTRVNLLMNYIRTIQTKEELLDITYETALPDAYQNRYDEIIAASMEIMERLKDKYLPNLDVEDEEQSNEE